MSTGLHNIRYKLQKAVGTRLQVWKIAREGKSLIEMLGKMDGFKRFCLRSSVSGPDVM